MKICDKTFDEERALYGVSGCVVEKCVFAGERDGESALKETSDTTVKDCLFELRYPLWHALRFSVEGCTFTKDSRAALWYGKQGKISHCHLLGIKAVRECDGVQMTNCTADSPELGWFCKNLDVKNCRINSEYFLLKSQNVTLEDVDFLGKYSFQYTKHVVIRNSVLHTKDAFWHAKNVRVENSVVDGEYLGWYSDGLTLVNCTITGTQPLCYCKNLTLENCTMANCDLAFEYSRVHARIKGNVPSVKNPLSGIITADSIGERILRDSKVKCRCKIESLDKN